MEEFQYKTRKEQNAMSMEELGEYKKAQRKYEYQNGIPLKGIKMRKMVHPVVVGALKLDRITSHQKISLIKKKKRPVIFACTHIGGSDVERIVEALGTPAYLFFGDPAPMYKDPTINTLVFLKGSIDLETNDREDRNIAFERAKELLSKGGNLTIFPEGAWNVFEHLPVMKIFPGATKMAIEAGADIVPVAIEQYDDEFIINVGNKIVTTADMDYKFLNDYLRDVLAELKYNIWETQPKLVLKPTTNQMVWEGVSVSEQVMLQKKYDEQYRQGIIDKRPGYGTLEEVYKAMYRDPSDTTADEIIAEIQTRIDFLKDKRRELVDFKETPSRYRSPSIVEEKRLTYKK